MSIAGCASIAVPAQFRRHRAHERRNPAATRVSSSSCDEQLDDSEGG
ncbi:hypothetical protein HMPREF9062_1345 [Actinomyces sp. oral taxon 448 str. F0400]|nr:hypothetical protein HMPREF9062_1345 [Actinomyces sp. oral taxon 448 str. F0400]